MCGHRNEVSDFDIICVGSNWGMPYTKEPILSLSTGEYRQVFHVRKPITEVIQELLDDFGTFLWYSRVTSPAHFQANSSPILPKGAFSWRDAQWPSLRFTITVSPETKAEFYWMEIHSGLSLEVRAFVSELVWDSLKQWLKLWWRQPWCFVTLLGAKQSL